MKIFNSPISYTGGKWLSVDRLWDLIPNVYSTVMSPFFGGGCFELNLAYHRGMKVIAGDLSTPVVNFWTHFLTDSHAVHNTACEFLKNYSYADVKAKKKLRLGMLGLQGAAWYYIYNRLSFSGKVETSSFVQAYEFLNGAPRGIRLVYKDRKVGWSGRKEPSYQYIFREFNPVPKGRVNHYFAPEMFTTLDINIYNVDFEVLLSQDMLTDTVVYCDPPYVGSERVYRTGKGFSHALLRDVLVRLERDWAVSYHDNDLVRELYDGFRFEDISYLSGFRNSEEKNIEMSDVLIMSPGLAEKYDAAEARKPKQLALFDTDTDAELGLF